MYKDLAKYYDYIFSWKDYKNEAGKIKKLILKYKRSKGNSLLEVGCGTGRHLEHFKKDFSCTGIDLNEDMLTVARKRLHGVRFLRGNMINFRMKRKFDVITCLFSSIGYVKTYKNLESTLNNFSRHLKQGGVVIIEPWFTKAKYRAGSPHLNVYEGKDIKIARASVSKSKNDISIMDMHYLIIEKGMGVKHYISHEELGMFETSKTLRLMKSVGLDAKFIRNVELMKDRGLYIGVKC